MIVKLYGLPRSGTNVLNFSMSINFQEIVCGFGEHNMHYLGWKHGKPSEIDVYNTIEQITNQKIVFVFIIRDFYDWSEAILQRHLGNWEFPIHTFSQEEGKLLYSTPMGYELYKDLKHLHEHYTLAYNKFAKENKEKSIVVKYEDLLKSQTEVIMQIKNKFGLTLNYKQALSINKKVNMNERL